MSSTPFFVLNNTFLDDVDDSFQARSSRPSRSTEGTSLRETANVQPSERLDPTTNVASILNECPDILDRVPVSHRVLQPIQSTSMDPCLRPFTMHSPAEYEEDSVFTSPASFLSAHAMPRSSEHDHSPKPTCDVDAGFPWANPTFFGAGIWDVQLDAPNPRALEGPIDKEANVIPHNMCLPSSQPQEPPAVGISQQPVFNSPRMVQSTRSTSGTMSSMPLLHDAGEGALHSEDTLEMPIARARENLSNRESKTAKVKEAQEAKAKDCIDQLEAPRVKARNNVGKRQRAELKLQEIKVRARLAECQDEQFEEFFWQEMTDYDMRRCIAALLDKSNGKELKELATLVGMDKLERENVVRATMKQEPWVEGCWKRWETRHSGTRARVAP